eukprot:62464_1
MELIRHLVLFYLVLISLNSVANATCDCTMINDVICCDEVNTYSSKCDALCNGEYDNCKPNKGPCNQGNNCCDGDCTPGACPSSGKPGKESSLSVSNCDPTSDPEDTLCCEGTTFVNKCEANVVGGILDCKPEKGNCSSGNSCCGGRCYQIDGGCPYSAKVMPKYSGLLSLSKSYGSTEQWNMTIIVILLVVFSACFLFLGLSVGAFYLRETNKIDYVNEDKEKSCESDL